MYSYTLWPMESNYLKCSSLQMIHSIYLKFGIYIIGHHSTYCVKFGEFKINSFFYRSTKKNFYTVQLIIYGVKLYEVCLCLNGAFD